MFGNPDVDRENVYWHRAVSRRGFREELGRFSTTDKVDLRSILRISGQYLYKKQGSDQMGSNNKTSRKWRGNNKAVARMENKQ
jgi:hypothetical protein